MSNILTKTIFKGLVLKGGVDVCNFDKKAENALSVNEKLLLNLVNENKDTEYGKKCGFADIYSIDDFRKKVPFSDYDTYAPYIERMINNREKNLITAKPIVQYVRTSGSIGAPKFIPVTQASVDVYLGYAITRMLFLADTYKKNKSGHHLTGARGLNTMEVADIYLADGTPCGNISGTASKKMKKFFPLMMTSPIPILFPEGNADMKYCKIRFAVQEKELMYFFSTFMSHVSDLMMYLQINWELICDDIEKGTINDKISMDDDIREKLLKEIKPDPDRAAELREIFKNGFTEDIMKKIWPNLSVISAIGTGGFSSYTKRIQTMNKDVPIDYSVYAASEGLFAAARNINVPEFNLIPDSCFFEFIPVTAEDDSKTLLLNELKVGEEYEIVITNLSGFYRYRIKDVIRVLGYQGECPRITFAYRKNQVLNIAGEKTTEEQVGASVLALSEKIGVPIPDYVVYLDDSVTPNRYAFIIEPDGKIDKNKLGEYSELLDKIICEKTFEYEESRQADEISPCIVYLQQPQTHLLWRDMKLGDGSTTNQVKPVRLIDSPKKYKFFTSLID